MEGSGLAGRAQTRGFTLVEVLVAFLVLAFVLAGAYAALADALRSESRAARVVDDILLARSYLAEAGVPRPLESGVHAETLPDGRRVIIEMREVVPFAVAGRPRIRAWRGEVELSGPRGSTLRLGELRLAAP